VAQGFFVGVQWASRAGSGRVAAFRARARASMLTTLRAANLPRSCIPGWRGVALVVKRKPNGRRAGRASFTKSRTGGADCAPNSADVDRRVLRSVRGRDRRALARSPAVRHLLPGTAWPGPLARSEHAVTLALDAPERQISTSTQPHKSRYQQDFVFARWLRGQNVQTVLVKSAISRCVAYSILSSGDRRGHYREGRKGAWSVHSLDRWR